MKSKRINYKKNKTLKKYRKQKGGFLQNMGFSLGGFGFSKQTGAKMYDPKTGKWLNQDCYNIMGIKFCTKPHE